MAKVKIKSIYINDTKADGTPYRDKNGNPFKMAVLESENGNKASMFIGKYQEKDLPIIQGWKPGDEVDVVIEKSGDFTNFKLPTRTDGLEERIKAVELRLSVLEGRMDNRATEPEKRPETPPVVSGEDITSDSTSVTLDDGAEMEIPF